MGASDDAVRIEYMPLRALRRAAHNPKRHDAAALTKSLDRFGYVAPMVLDEATERLVAGHGRLEALAAARDAGAAPPARVQVTADDWLVPVIRGVRFASEADAAAYLLADNKLVELGGWDDAELAAMLRDLDGDVVASTGFSSREVDVLLRSIAGPVADPGAQMDRAAELQAKWGTARGQLWTVGRHRVCCGDATSAEDVARLLDGDEPRIMVTDPPYGVEYDPKWRNEAAAKGLIAFAPTREGDVANDERIDWSQAWTLSPASVAYCWHAGRHASEVQISLESAKYEIRAQVIWAKSRFAISRGHYHWQHEPCWYAVRASASAEWIGDRSQTTLWTIELDPNVDGGHSTQKPLECMARPIRNHGGDVYDPFLGTGTTVIAAEQLERRCYGLDIEPHCIAITLERLATMGLTPALVP